MIHMNEIMNKEKTKDCQGELWGHGWCRMPRTIMLLLDDNLRKAQTMGVFLWLVMHASPRDLTSPEDAERGRLPLMRGQLHLQYGRATKELGLTDNQLRYTLSTLQSKGLVTVLTKNYGRVRACVVTICEYNCYNGLLAPVGVPSAEDVQGLNQVLMQEPVQECLNKNEEFKQERENVMKKKSSPTTFGSRSEGLSSSAVRAGSDEEPTVSVRCLASQMMEQRAWVEHFCESHGMSEDELRAEVARFVSSLADRGTMEKTMSDALKHFASWHNVRCQQVARREEENVRRVEEASRRREQEVVARREQREEFEREQDESRVKFLREIFAKADSGDERARMVIARHGLVRER